MTQVLTAVLISGLIAVYGLSKKSLSLSGAVGAFLVGTLHFICGVRFGVTLIVFFLSASRLTKYKSAFKSKVEEDFKENGQRTVWQVLANGTGGCIFALLAALNPGNQLITDVALAGFLGHYACCCADTFSSEFGILSKLDPILITTGQVVPRGTNGGVSMPGTLAGAAGGLFMGLCFWFAGRWDATSSHSSLSLLLLVPLGFVLGLIGTFLDSLVGATCQYTGYSSQLGRVVGQPGPGVSHVSGKALLSNSMVNFVTATFTATLAALVVLVTAPAKQA